MIDYNSLGLNIIKDCSLISTYEPCNTGGKLLLRIQKGANAFVVELPDDNKWQSKAMEFIQNNKE